MSSFQDNWFPQRDHPAHLNDEVVGDDAETFNTQT